MSLSRQKVYFKSGFSLIELLIVIGIIVIIAGFSIPAINSLRNKGKESACLNNMRQWGQAMNMYLDDHRGVFPTAGTGQNGDDDAWYNRLPPYLELETFSQLQARGKAPCAGSGKNIFVCPAEDIDGARAAKYAGSTQKEYALSYAMNYWINAPKNEKNLSERMRFSQVKTADMFVVLSEPSDTTKHTVAAYPKNSGQTSKVTSRHNKKFHALFADGRVAALRTQDAGMLQWDPHYAPGEEPPSGDEEDEDETES